MQFLASISNALCEQEEVKTMLAQRLGTISKTKICIYLFIAVHFRNDSRADFLIRESTEAAR